MTELLPLFLIILFFSCVSTSTFQHAKTLKKKQVAVGSGFTAVPGLIYDTFIRYGFSDKLEGGAKISLCGISDLDINHFNEEINLKYQIFNNNKFYMAFNNQLNMRNYINQDSTDYYQFYFTSSFIISGRIISGGLKLSSILGNYYKETKDLDEKLSHPFPGVFLSFFIGKKFKFIPEVNVYYYPVKFYIIEDVFVHVVPAIGFQYSFGTYE